MWVQSTASFPLPTLSLSLVSEVSKLRLVQQEYSFSTTKCEKCDVFLCIKSGKTYLKSFHVWKHLLKKVQCWLLIISHFFLLWSWCTNIKFYTPREILHSTFLSLKSSIIASITFGRTYIRYEKMYPSMISHRVHGRVKYLSFHIEKGTLRPDPDRLKPLKELPIPTDISLR